MKYLIGIVCILLFVLNAACDLDDERFRVVCYHTDALDYGGLRRAANKVHQYCTHMVYVFGDEHTDPIIYDSHNEFNKSLLREDNLKDEMTTIKMMYPKLLIHVAIGGFKRGSANFSEMAATADTRQNFIQNCLTFALTLGLDGLVLQWDYPARGDSVHSADDVENFNQLLKEFRPVFDEHKLLLSAAVAPLERDASVSYDVATISKYLDYVHVMAFNLHGPRDNETGHSAALHPGEGYRNERRESLATVDVAIEYWLKSGCPPEKLVLGVSFLGHSFTLADPAVNGVRAPSTGPGIAGPLTKTPGNLAYHEICVLLKTQTWKVTKDEAAKVPYASRDDIWLSFENAASIRAKVEYARSLKLAGIMAWSVESDDVNNACGNGAFPLLKAMSNDSDPASTTPLFSSIIDSLLR